MKIKRNILGHEIEIELTDAEVLDAYTEKEMEYRQWELNDYLTGVHDYRDIPDEIVIGMAEEYKRSLDDYFGSPRFESDCADIINIIIEKHEALLKQYKEEDE